jgi:hypothetical protein
MLGTIALGNAVRAAAWLFAEATRKAVDLAAHRRLAGADAEVDLVVVPLACTADEWTEITGAPAFARAAAGAEALHHHGLLAPCAACGALGQVE